MSDILPHGNRQSEFAEQADVIEELARDVRKGEILAAAWVTLSADSKWDWNSFKARGRSTLELNGAVFQMAHEMARDLEGT